MSARTGAANGERPFVSVIVPVRDDTGRLRRCLEALRSQSYPAERFEIVVVDDGSAPPVPSELGDGVQVRLLHNPPTGSYAARNVGIAAARGDVVAFTDADCRPEAAWLERGVERLVARKYGVVVAGSIEMVFGGSRAIELYEQRTALRQYEYVADGGFGATANLLASRLAVERVGRFDAALESGGDVDWCRRAARAGFPLVYEAQARVFHPTSRSLHEVLRRARRLSRAYETVAHDSGSFYIGPPRPGWSPPEGRRIVLDLLPPGRLALSILAGVSARDAPTRLGAVVVAVCAHYAAVGESIAAKLHRRSR